MVAASPTAILLCAGLGSRLLPLTADRPKCLIEVGGRTIIDHQVTALRQAGIERVVVVGGYCFDRLETSIAERWSAGERPELIFNPFYAAASSIGSVWEARAHLNGPFCLLNGDTIYDPALVADGLGRADERLGLFVEASDAPAPDDMLVRLDGERVTAVGKSLDPETAGHRSLGFVVTRDGGGAGYVGALGSVLRQPDGAQLFHHAVVDRLAQEACVAAITFANGTWTEVDRPEDIARWTNVGSGAAGRAAQQGF